MSDDFDVSHETQEGGDIEDRARRMGWTPKDEFKGDPGRWIDADTFVERGETVLPILRAQNRKLEDQVAKQAKEMNELRSNFAATQESIEALKAVHAEATAAAVENAKAELKAQLRAAREDGDIDAEMEIREQMDNLNEQLRQSEQKSAPQQPQQPAMHPDWAAWQAENSWYGSDQRKTMRALGIAQELRGDPEFDSLQGRAFFDKVVEVMDERAGGGRPTSKTTGSRPSGAAGGGKAGGYDAMPADAKEVCDKQAKKLVGENRAFKDIGAWRSYYAKLYFGGEQ